MRQPKGRIAVWPDVIAGAYAAAFFVWLALPGQTRASRELLDNLFFLPLGIAVAWMSARTARLWPYDRATRRGWALLASAQALRWLSGTVWGSLQTYAPSLVATAWAENLSFISYPLLVISILQFPGVYRDRPSRARYLLDLALIFAGCLLGVWYFSFLPAASRQVSLSTALAWPLFYPTADLVVIALCGVAILSATHPTTRRALAWLCVGRVVRMSATIAFSLVRSGNGYQPGHWVDGLWFSAWMFAWIAARVPQHRLASGVTDREREQVRTYRSGGLPVLSVIFAQGLLLWLLRGEMRSAPGIVAIATTVLTGLIALRQVAELRENARLRDLERRQESRFRSLVQRGSDVVLVVGGEGEILYKSPSAERLVPRAGKEAGEPPSFSAFFDTGDTAALRGLIERLERGQASSPLPARALRADGKVVHLEFLAADLRHDSAVAGVVLTGRDVTERHLLADELRRTEKLRAVGQTAGGIAHDLNNILFALRGNAELLLEDLPDQSTARAEVAEIIRAADRGAAVTRKLLQFSRREMVRLGTLDVNSVVMEFEPVLRQFISSGIEVRLDYAKAPSWVVIDRVQLEQVVLNLSMNARDAMPNGGTLRLRIDQRGADAGGEVTLAIQDTGVGMDAATRSRIFEPFFTTKPQGEGTGLGLASAYGIVTSAGGKLEVESVQGQGTTFTVVLPRAPAPGVPGVAA